MSCDHPSQTATRRVCPRVFPGSQSLVLCSTHACRLMDRGRDLPWLQDRCVGGIEKPFPMCGREQLGWRHGCMALSTKMSTQAIRTAGYSCSGTRFQSRRTSIRSCARSLARPLGSSPVHAWSFWAIWSCLRADRLIERRCAPLQPEQSCSSAQDEGPHRWSRPPRSTVDGVTQPIGLVGRGMPLSERIRDRAADLVRVGLGRQYLTQRGVNPCRADAVDDLDFVF